MLPQTIRAICLNAPDDIDNLSKKKQRNLYNFLNSFASDSRNIPSCN